MMLSGSPPDPGANPLMAARSGPARPSTNVRCRAQRGLKLESITEMPSRLEADPVAGVTTLAHRSARSQIRGVTRVAISLPNPIRPRTRFGARLVTHLGRGPGRVSQPGRYLLSGSLGPGSGAIGLMTMLNRPPIKGKRKGLTLRRPRKRWSQATAKLPTQLGEPAAAGSSDSSR